MDCRKAQKQYIEFINDRLDIWDLAKFLKHMEICEDCREEYDIYYMMIEGMRFLENEQKEKMPDSTQKLQYAKEYLIKYRIFKIEKWVIFALLLAGVMILFV